MLIQPMLPARLASGQSQRTQTGAVKVVGIGPEGWRRVGKMLDHRVPEVSFLVIDGKPTASEADDCRVEFLTPGDGEIAGLQPSLQGSELVFIAASTGRDYNPDALAQVADAARETGALVVGVITPTFKIEEFKPGRQMPGADWMLPFVDRLMVIQNHRLSDFVDRDTGILSAMDNANQVVADGIMDLVDMLTTTAETGGDLAGLKAMLNQPGGAVLASGVGRGAMAALEATRQAIADPTMERSLQEAAGALFLVNRGDQLPFGGVNAAGALIVESVGTEAKIGFGSRINPDLKDTAKVTVVATGLDLAGPSRATSTQKETNIGSPSNADATAALEKPIKPEKLTKEEEKVMITNPKNNNKHEHKMSLMAMLAWPVLTFSRVIAGPPMSDRDRARAAAYEAMVYTYKSNII
ncbi:MAG: hypothetical protein ACE5Q6_11400 [Dehalococcoidia bacterium]